MWRLSILLLLLLLTVTVFIATPGVALAEVIYVEDFEDANGAPAFDAMFSHEFLGDGWCLAPDSVYPEYGWGLSMGGTTDTIHFDVEPGKAIVYASVEYRGMASCWVTLVGLDSEEKISLGLHSQYHRIEVSSVEIGEIVEMRLQGSEGIFDNITIHVVPEPAGILLLFAGLGTCVGGSVTRFRQG